MAYIGNQIRQYSDRVVLDSLTASATANYTLQLNGSNYVPSSAESLTVSLNGIIQKPQNSYTVSGSTLSFASALTASDSIDFVIAERGITLQTPSAGSVNTEQLASNAVTTAKIADDAVTKDKLSAHNYPAFEATLSANQSIPNTTATKVQFNTENYDTNGYYDNATNYRFTPLVAGKYFVYSYVRFLSIVDGNQGIVYLYKNGSSISFTSNGSAGGTNAVNFSTIITQIIDLNGSTDYIEAFVYQDSGSSKNIQGGSGGGFTTTFGAYRIGD